MDGRALLAIYIAGVLIYLIKEVAACCKSRKRPGLECGRKRKGRDGCGWKRKHKFGLKNVMQEIRTQYLKEGDDE